MLKMKRLLNLMQKILSINLKYIFQILFILLVSCNRNDTHNRHVAKAYANFTKNKHLFDTLINRIRLIDTTKNTFGIKFREYSDKMIHPNLQVKELMNKLDITMVLKEREEVYYLLGTSFPDCYCMNPSRLSFLFSKEKIDTLNRIKIKRSSIDENWYLEVAEQ